jgi:NADH-quinone oxidoreductase subunit N
MNGRNDARKKATTPCWFVKLMYFDDPTDSHAIEAGGTLRAVLSANGVAVLALGVFPSALIDLCARVLP